ncbi:bone morphogenetic protein 4-like [Dysidea avara]|uniref:bone morphogenetic protein 4-like n=1 Tax=Dysidea avara TaxID=196820 RepID=UPI003332C193
MMKFSVCLLLTISHFTAHSVPIRHLVEEQQPVKVTRREANSDSENIDDNLEINEFARELTNATLPSYLKDLFANFNFPSELAHTLKNQKMTKANTIRSFENQAMGTGCGYYKFGIDKASIDGEEIIHAELRLLQMISMPGDYYEVNIYYLLNDNNIDSPLKLTFKHTDSSLGWKTFDVTPIVENWKQGWANYGLKVTLTKGEQQLSCEGVYSSEEQEDILNTKPLLVVFTRANTNKFLSELFKDKGISDIKHKKVRRESNSTSSIQTSHVSCHLQKMEVSNTAISAGNIHLVVPKFFDVGVCGGHCPRLPVESLTDYASILSLHYYQTRGHEGAPKRCCVPTNFELIQMVFYNELTHETIYKNVPARATSCGCV